MRTLTEKQNINVARLIACLVLILGILLGLVACSEDEDPADRYAAFPITKVTLNYAGDEIFIIAMSAMYVEVDWGNGKVKGYNRPTSGTYRIIYLQNSDTTPRTITLTGYGLSAVDFDTSMEVASIEYIRAFGTITPLYVGMNTDFSEWPKESDLIIGY